MYDIIHDISRVSRLKRLRVLRRGIGKKKGAKCSPVVCQVWRQSQAAELVILTHRPVIAERIRTDE